MNRAKCGLTVVSVLAFIVGCPLPLHRMQEAFAESLEKTVGRTIDELTNHPNRFIGTRTPTEITHTADGLLLYLYADYWGSYGMSRNGGACDVYLEIDPDSMKVVSARAVGGGCYRPY